MYIYIDIAKQVLHLKSFDDNILKSYNISSAKNGLGEQMNSNCTPRGWHIIKRKYGRNAPPGSVFNARRLTGEIYSNELAKEYPKRDWILTRIMWLSGIEPYKNRFLDKDTLKRYIYIHGTPEDEPMGVPFSHGCIRMHSMDIIDLYNQVDTGTKVYISKTNYIGDN